jgi:hypothetical protein
MECMLFSTKFSLPELKGYSFCIAKLKILPDNPHEKNMGWITPHLWKVHFDFIRRNKMPCFCFIISNFARSYAEGNNSIQRKWFNERTM